MVMALLNISDDKLQDLSKELHIRMLDGSHQTQEALSVLGLDESVADIQIILDRLQDVTDKQKRYELGITLFSGQYEDICW